MGRRSSIACRNWPYQVLPKNICILLFSICLEIFAIYPIHVIFLFSRIVFVLLGGSLNAYIFSILFAFHSVCCFFSSFLHTVFFVYWIDNSLVCCLRLLFMTIFCGSTLSLHVKNIKIEWLVYLNKIYFEDNTKKNKFLIVHTSLFNEWIFSVNERVI